jgi:hypothetical protein
MNQIWARLPPTSLYMPTAPSSRQKAVSILDMIVSPDIVIFVKDETQNFLVISLKKYAIILWLTFPLTLINGDTYKIKARGVGGSALSRCASLVHRWSLACGFLSFGIRMGQFSRCWKVFDVICCKLRRQPTKWVHRNFLSSNS